MSFPLSLLLLREFRGGSFERASKDAQRFWEGLEKESSEGVGGGKMMFMPVC